MKQIDRLLIKANKLYGKTAQALYMAFITPVNGEFDIEAQIQGKEGVEVIKDHRATLEDANIFLEELSNRYPNKEQINVFIDYGEEPEESI